MELALIVDGISTRHLERPKFSSSYDIAVVGLGTAGAEAFRQAVRSGLGVIGIEKYNGMGGQGTIGCVSFSGSIPIRMRDLERQTQKGEVCYETVLIGVWIDGKRLAGVRTLANGLVRDVSCRVVIDASGNALVSRILGFPVRKGRDFDGVVAPCARAESWRQANGNIRPIYCNYSDDVTGTSRAYSSTVSMLARERYKHWLHESKKSVMLKPSMLVGAREEHRVWTEEVLTLADALSERKFFNPIFYAWEPEDLPVFYADHAFESRETQNWKVVCGLPLFGYPAVLTYGTLVAKGVDNLLVPSKHFGVSHDLGGAIRMQEQMRKTGVAAALAAELMIKDNLAAREVPYAKLRPLLERAGLLKPARKAFVTSYHGFEFRPFTDDEVVDALKQDVTRTTEWWYAKSKNDPSERAAYAYWTAWKRRLSGADAERRALADKLAVELNGDKRYVGNFAIALGLMEDERALPVLREIVANPGGPEDPVIANAYPNRIKAILMLGRLVDQASVAPMMGIIRDDARKFVNGLAKAKAFVNEDICRFQALSYTLMALKSILARHPNSKLTDELRAWSKRDFSIVHKDGTDLALRLKKVF